MLMVLEFVGFLIDLRRGYSVGSRQVVLTFDVENDFNFPTFKGLKIGLPRILRLLERYKIPATFFVTGDVVEKYPKIIRNLSERYEVGCHGYHHESFQKMDPQKVTLIKSAKKFIEEIIEQQILGFRAPYLRVCPELFDALRKVGFKYDSSLSWFNVLHWPIKESITEFRLMFPNVFFRFPLFNHLFKISCLLNRTPVFYFHPWEALDVRNLLITRPHYSWNIFSRPDRWLNSGPVFLSRLSDLIRYLLRHHFKFTTLKDIYFSSPKMEDS